MFIKTIAVILSAALCAMTAGCGNVGDGDKDADGKTEVVVTYTLKEIGGTGTTAEEVFADFEKANPDIKVVVEPGNAADPKIVAMIAAGNAPDILRFEAANDIPTLVSRNLLLPLDKYIEKSKNIDKDDFSDVFKLFSFDGKEQGAGQIYGAPKDWGVGYQMWINKKLFREAGLPTPSATEPMTFDELAEYANKLTVHDATGGLKQIGFLNGFDEITLTKLILAQQGKSLWTDDFSSSTLLTQPETKNAIKYILDLQKSGGMASSLNPVDSWSNWFFEGKIGILGFGYFVTSILNNNTNLTEEQKADFMLVPTPVVKKGQKWTGQLTAVGAGIAAQSKHHDEAYKVWEYIHFGQLSEARAKSGFGLPALKSKMSLLPNTTEVQKNALETVNSELNFETKGVIRNNPFVNATSFSSAFEKYYTPVLYGQADLDESLKSIDEELKTLISEGKAIGGAK